MHDQSLLDMLSQIVHDLKSPLSTVKTLIDGIEEFGDLNEKQQHFADRAKTKLVFMTQMVSMILEMAWLESDQPLEFRSVDLGALVRSSIDMQQEMAAAKHVLFHLAVEKQAGLIEGDEHRLQQAVSNLVSNAVKYNVENGHVYIRISLEGDRVKVSVEDTGKGIPEEDQPHIFDKFFRSKASVRARIEGTGLGLAIVKSVIERHHGDIWFTSEPEKGTTFTFTVPRIPPELSDTAEAIVAQERAARGTAGDEISDAVDDSIQESLDKSDEAADSHAEAGKGIERRHDYSG